MTKKEFGDLYTKVLAKKIFMETDGRDPKRAAILTVFGAELLSELENQMFKKD